MTKPTHINFGILANLLLLIYNPVFSPFMILTPLLAILADADHGKDSISKKLMPIPGKHRGWTHTILFSLVVVGIAYGIGMYFGYEFGQWDMIVLGVLVFSHVMGDFFTVSGVSFLRPITNYNFKMPIFNVTTNTKSEHLISFIVFVVNIILGFYLIGKFDEILVQLITFFETANQIGYIIIISMFLLIGYLFNKEIKLLKRNVKKVFSYIKTILFSTIIVGVIGFGVSLGLFYFAPDLIFIGFGVLILGALYLIYKFYSMIHLLMPVLIYTFIGLFYVLLFLLMLFNISSNVVALG